MDTVIGWGQRANKESLLDITSGVVGQGMALALYSCLEDSYEENRLAALNILRGTVMI
jgi:hypothetical protein